MSRVDIVVIMRAITIALDFSFFLPYCSRGDESKTCEMTDEHWSEGKTIVNDDDGLEA